MASPLQTGKQSVDLATPGVSRIRRDPPPVARKTVVPDRDDSHTRTVVIGVLAFAVAIVIAVIGISAATGWSPRHYTAHL